MDRKRILLAVNNSSEIAELRDLLLSKGYEVKIALDGAQAVKFSREFRPHLILAEVDLTQVDGHHLLKEVRGHFGTKHIAFVMMSKHRSVDERVHTISLGVDDYLPTPFDPREALARFQILISEFDFITSRSKPKNKHFSGKLSEFSVVEIIQTLEIAKKTGILYLKNSEEQGRISLFDGEITDAKFRKFDVTLAVQRLLVWNDGNFRFEKEAVQGERIFKHSTAVLAGRALIYKSQWDSFSKELPSLNTLVQLDKSSISLASVSEKVFLQNAVQPITLLELIYNSKKEDIEALPIAAKLYKKGLLKSCVGNNDNLDITATNGSGRSPGVKNSRILRLVGSFTQPPLQTKNRIAQVQEYSQTRLSDLHSASRLPHFNKSELLIIREKLLKIE